MILYWDIGFGDLDVWGGERFIIFFVVFFFFVGCNIIDVRYIFKVFIMFVYILFVIDNYLKVSFKIWNYLLYELEYILDIYCNVVVMDIVLYLIIMFVGFFIVSYWFFRFCFWFECFGWSYYRNYFFLVGCIIILIDIFFSFFGFVISCNVYVVLVGFFFKYNYCFFWILNFLV